MLALQQYGESDSDKDDEEKKEDTNNDALLHLTPLSIEQSSIIQTAICPAPAALPPVEYNPLKFIKPGCTEMTVNLKYEELFAADVGPENPYLTDQQKAPKNILSGYVEEAHMSEFQFENQRKTFQSFGYALDPSIDNMGRIEDSIPVVGAVDVAKDTNLKTVFESTSKRPLDKRKRNKNDDPSDINGFLGPWGCYVDEKKVVKPEPEVAAELEEYLAKRQKLGKKVEDKPLEEKTVLHIKDPVDYQGRNFLHPPQDVGVNLKSDSPPDKCFIPKSEIHVWKGHTKGISAIRWFPKYAHLLLSCSMDCRVKLWEVYNERRCIRTYYGHRQAVRDVCFNNRGTKFLSAAYDRYIKLWDTETGECISRFTSRKIPYCVKFNPDEDKQNLFVAGTSDKKIICWDSRSGEIVQEYDRHLGAVNSITFVDENRRFVTTSDDKSLRVWEWDIPVDMKYIADPSMHSMPAVTPSPNQKWLACQSMDNKIVIFSALNRFKLNRKKTFTGHMVAGYACTLDFSPDMSYIVSGDADGKAYVWDWKTTKLFKKWKAHDHVCIGVLWHPHEPSKVVTAGWDGLIKYWD
ncbi:pre-mRNA-processing factor 17 isoform X1 [Halyomorpha halys]|uniref:pre-mRNA-processing factor 17 isoform X1 n=2 Tax=Halyomorpha halys TaxID=286706 RepID=UPI000D0C7CE8|nr:pre-mRNA-processing factor 17 isoform X1 [Halyomorpha halys]